MVMVPLQEEFEKFLTQNKERYRHIQILSLWDEVIGEKLAKFTKAKKFRQGTLVVEVKEKEWQIELPYHVGDILKKYQKQLPEIEVKKIYFKYNPYLEKIYLNSKERSPFQPQFEPAIIDRETSLEDSLARLKVIWKTKAQQEEQLTDVNKKHSSAPSVSSTRPLRKNIVRDEMYSVKKIHSEFLRVEDEFQPFDLY